MIPAALRPKRPGFPMRILSIAPYPPHPQDNGGRIRSHQVLEALALRHDVTVVTQTDTTGPGTVTGWSLVPRLARAPIIVDAYGRPPETAAGRALQALEPEPLPGRPGYLVRREPGALWDALAALDGAEFDVVHARLLSTARFALALRRQYPHLRAIIDLDDILSKVQAREIAASGARWLSRWRANMLIEAARLRWYERRYLPGFDRVWVCSDDDRAELARWLGDRARTVPNAVDLDAFPAAEPPADSRRAVYVGDFRHPPNVQAALHFLEHGWAAIAAAVPGASFWLVGRSPPRELTARHDPAAGIHVTGSVPDVRPYLQQAALTVVPLLVGGGTRIKILESLAAGVPVVSTTVGAEGIPARPGHEILIADEPAAFAAHCIRLLTDAAANRAQRAAGRRFVADRFSIGVLREAVWAAC